MGSTPPDLSPLSDCVPPGNQRGGGQHSLAGEGAEGANSDDQRESLACTLSTLWSQAAVNEYVEEM